MPDPSLAGKHSPECLRVPSFRLTQVTRKALPHGATGDGRQLLRNGLLDVPLQIAEQLGASLPLASRDEGKEQPRQKTMRREIARRHDPRAVPLRTRKARKPDIL